MEPQIKSHDLGPFHFPATESAEEAGLRPRLRIPLMQENVSSPMGNNGNHSICTLYFKRNVNSLCRNKVFKQTAESVNDVVSFLCPDEQK